MRMRRLRLDRQTDPQLRVDTQDACHFFAAFFTQLVQGSALSDRSIRCAYPQTAIVQSCRFGRVPVPSFKSSAQLKMPNPSWGWLAFGSHPAASVRIVEERRERRLSWGRVCGGCCCLPSQLGLALTRAGWLAHCPALVSEAERGSPALASCASQTHSPVALRTNHNPVTTRFSAYSHQPNFPVTVARTRKVDTWTRLLNASFLACHTYQSGHRPFPVTLPSLSSSPPPPSTQPSTAPTSSQREAASIPSPRT